MVVLESSTPHFIDPVCRTRKKMENSIMFDRRKVEDDEDTNCVREDKDKFIHAPIDRLGYIGIWLRSMLLKAIILGTPVLMLLQKRRTKLLNKMMAIFSFLGTEDFYTPVLCIVAWNIDMKLGRLMAISMAAGFYTASLFKNILCLPRPPSPPVIPLEKAFDWSLPSHHSIIGVVLPFYTFFYSYEHYQMSAGGLSLLFFIISSWSFLVMFSRLYLGVHSPADIVCGGFMGCFLLILILHVDDYIDQKCSKDYMAVIQAFIYSLLLLAIHPQIRPQTMSFADTVCTTSVALGVVLAGYTQAHLPLRLQSINWSIFEEREKRNLENLSYLYILTICSIRIVIGFPLVLLCRAFTKYVVKYSLKSLCKLSNIPCYSFSDHVKENPMNNKHYCEEYVLPPLDYKLPKEEEEARLFDIDIVTKFITYIFTGFSGFFFTMFVFYYFGLTLGSNGVSQHHR